MPYPVIEHLKVSKRAEAGEERTGSLRTENARGQSLPLEQAVPLFADLMSLALPANRYPPLNLSAQEQREQTLDALAAWLFEEAERRPVLHVWEDLQWADPTTLELLRIYLEQSQTASMMNVLTYRPEFVPPWTMHSHMTPITINA
jgi:predicted ATPase